MRRRRVDAGLERQILIGMLTSDAFIASVSVIASDGELSLVDSVVTRRIMEWCVEFQRTYGRAPRRSIVTVYEAWCAGRDADEETDATRDLLADLSTEYESSDGTGLNVPHLRDRFAEYLSTKKLHRLRDNLESSLLRGDVSGALEEVQSFRQVKSTPESGRDLLVEDAGWKEAFESPLQPLIEFPFDAGRFLNQAMTRDALVAIEGPEKVGKTNWCIEFAVRALQCRRRVAFFESGDLTSPQLYLRWGAKLDRAPIWESDVGTTIEVPISVDGQGTVEYARERPSRTVTLGSSKVARQRFMLACGLSPSHIWIMESCHPNKTLSPRRINSILDGWESERGFVPDVIIIDYADTLISDDTRRDTQRRDQINDVWMELRRLSQERRALVIVPTQANAKAYKSETIGMTSVSEDKRKHAHVTAMIGLNQRSDEKDRGVMRLNWVVGREFLYSGSQCLWVGQCPKLGMAFCCSAFMRGNRNEAAAEGTG